MKTSFSLMVILLSYQSTAIAYQGSRYNDLKQQIFEVPYATLPLYQVSKKLFGKSGDHSDNHLLAAARRTLTSKEDLLAFPQRQKLLQANGICFAGQWVIDKPSAYSGQFQYLTQTPVIARASVALSGTLHTDIRAFGFALKLFPEPEKTASTLNVFVINSMGGARSRYALDYIMDNAPPLGSLPSFMQLTTAYRLLQDLKRADKMMGSKDPDVSFRPITHLAAYGQPVEVISPTWLRLTAAEDLIRMDKSDFREELRVEHYPQQTLIWNISVASHNGENKKRARWQTIGKLILTESITSKSCDQQLHFSHPLLR
jgi:hypothetical protein